jgi:hypothetical protein
LLSATLGSAKELVAHLDSAASPALRQLWSMIDIFMEALLGALVKFGSVITIEPGIGAIALCGVMILTMFAG